MVRKIITTFFLLLVYIVPTGIYAKTCDEESVTIEKITISEKSNNTIEVTPPKLKNKKLSFDIKFKEVGDSITYKITVKNDSKEDIALSEEDIDKDTNYIEYILKSGSGIVKSGKEKDFYLQITYKNKVELKSYNEGKFIENQSIPFDLTGNIETSIINAHNKSNLIIIFISLGVIVVTLVGQVILKKVILKKNFIWIIGLLLIPGVVRALCNYSIKIDAKIEIDNPVPTFKVKYVNCGTLIDGDFEFREGMTIKEWVGSEYLNTWLDKRMKDLGVGKDEIITKSQMERQYLLEDIVTKITQDENYIIKNKDVLEYNNPDC